MRANQSWSLAQKFTTTSIIMVTTTSQGNLYFQIIKGSCQTHVGIKTQAKTYLNLNFTIYEIFEESLNKTIAEMPREFITFNSQALKVESAVLI